MRLRICGSAQGTASWACGLHVSCTALAPGAPGSQQLLAPQRKDLTLHCQPVLTARPPGPPCCWVLVPCKSYCRVSLKGRKLTATCRNGTVNVRLICVTVISFMISAAWQGVPPASCAGAVPQPWPASVLPQRATRAWMLPRPRRRPPEDSDGPAPVHSSGCRV